MAMTDAQIRYLAATTPLWYDALAARADRAERYGMGDDVFLALVQAGCETGDERWALRVIDAGIEAFVFKAQMEQLATLPRESPERIEEMRQGIMRLAEPAEGE